MLKPPPVTYTGNVFENSFISPRFLVVISIQVLYTLRMITTGVKRIKSITNREHVLQIPTIVIEFTEYDAK